MKKILLTFFINLSILCLVNAQWQYINNIPTTKDLYSVYFPTSDTGFTVGAAGTILKTVDSGNTWISQISNTSQNLKKVFFVNSHTGWAVGDTGTILKTSNGGALWVPQNSNIGDYYTVFFINTDTGFVAGKINNTGKIIKTIDGGINWTENYSLGQYQYQYIKSLYFTSKDTGFAGSADTIYRTINGGTNWIPIPSPLYGICNSLFFSNSNIGYALGGYNSFIKTIDGGNSWILKQNNLAYITSSFFFTEIDTGYVIGNNYNGWIGIFLESVILKTNDGGNTFNSIYNIASNKVLNSVFFTNSNTGFIVGNNGTILKTTNGGVSSIPEKTKIQNINFYPNPANNNVFIELPSIFLISKLILTISDIDGQQLIEQQLFSAKTEVNINNLPKGVYVVKVFNNDNVLVKKLVKQ